MDFQLFDWRNEFAMDGVGDRELKGLCQCDTC
jgi:hypothetical protein